MGKNKQTQRTKNNARPSSSGRSAELLGTSVSSFVGFSAVKNGEYVPVLPGLAISAINDIEMNGIDSSFQLVLKKMNKKDGTTKLKALQEFAELCDNSEIEKVEAMLPFWPRLYCLLVVDVEHRVREAVHIAHAAVVKRVGRNIAIYLKQIAGPWFTSQYDTYPPAASAATNSFREAFPPKKIIDAIVHCQVEILSYICNNIITQTSQSLSTHKTLTAEEMEARYQRVLVSSLQGYCLYLKKVPSHQIERTRNIHQKIISNNKFWKLAKYDAPLIKTAFFNVLTSMIEHAGQLLKDEKKKTMTVITNSLDESEPGLVSAVWESMLVAINKIEDWHTVVSIEKLVLPKLWCVLRNGGQCSAGIVYPNLLPFIGQFPKLNTDGTSLYTNFFNNMRQGFLAKSVQTSRSETFAVTTSFVECLRYVILLNNDNQDLCEKLLKEQLMPMIELCIKETTPIEPILFNQVSHLVRYWSKNRGIDLKSYSYLVQQFWAQLALSFNDITDPTDENYDTAYISNLHSSQIDLLLSLKNMSAPSRKNLKVKFSDSNEPVEARCRVEPVEFDKDALFLKELNQFVGALCTLYFNKINTRPSKQNIEYFGRLVSNFESREIFTILTESCSADADFLKFYEQTLKTWLTERSDQMETAIQLVFGLIKYMDEPGKDAVLDSLTKLDDTAVLKSAVRCALSKKNRNDNVAKEWRSHVNVTSLLIDVAKEIAYGDSTIDVNLDQDILALAFEGSDDGDLLISETAMNDIASILCGSLNVTHQGNVTNLAKLISLLLSLTWAYKQPISGAIEMLETLFELSIGDDFNDCNLALVDVTRNTWKRGLFEISRKLPSPRFIEFAKRFAAVVCRKIFEPHSLRFKNRLVDMVTDFVESVVSTDTIHEIDHFKEITLAFLTESNVRASLIDVTGIVLYGEVISGNLYISEPCRKVQICQDLVSIDMRNRNFVDNIENCLRWALFSAKLLNELLSRTRESEEDNPEKMEHWKRLRNIILPGIEETLINIVYIATLGHLYGHHYKSTKHYNSASALLSSLKEEFADLGKYLTKDIYDKVQSHFESSYARADILPHVLRFYCTELRPNYNFIAYFENYGSNGISISNDESATEEARLRYVQTLSMYLKLENIPLTLEEDVRALVIARSMLTERKDNSLFIEILERIIKRHEKDPNFLLFDRDIFQVTWKELTSSLEVIRFLTKFATAVPTKLTNSHWDFVLISLNAWQLSVNKSKRSYDDLKVTALIVAVSQLYRAIQSLMYKHESEPIVPLPATLLDEWKNVFADDIHVGLTRAWMFYADLSDRKKNMSLMLVIPLDNLGEAMRLLDGRIFFKKWKSSSHVELVTSERIIELSLKLLLSPVPSLQLAAYHALKHVIPELVDGDNKVTAIDVDSFDSRSLNIQKFEGVLLHAQNIVNTMLMDFRLYETVSCTIEPYTDSYTYTLGYLLAWAIVLNMCSSAHAELRYRYAETLKNDLFPCLLNNLFKLMPVEVLQDNKSKVPKLVDMFSTVPSLNFAESWTEWRLDHLVCWLYANSLRHLPVLVRQWWGTSDSRVSATADKITTLYVSPMLCQEELLNDKLTNIENMQVKVHPTAREVVALYQVDDTKLELSMVLPTNHPLGPVTVEPGQRAGGTTNWRNCLMQLSIFLTHQNGSIWDGLILWKRNLDKRFSGVEECYICFSIFHSSTYQIPKLSCHTCRKKFHTPCLYKWFNTSQKSTCPICRNVF